MDRDSQLGLGVCDVDDVGAVIIDRTDGEIAFLVEAAGCEDTALNIGPRIL